MFLSDSYCECGVAATAHIDNGVSLTQAQLTPDYLGQSPDRQSRKIKNPG